MKRAKHMLAMAVVLAMTAGLIARAADGDDATPIIDDDSEFVSPDGLTITNSATGERRTFSTERGRQEFQRNERNRNGRSSGSDRQRGGDRQRTDRRDLDRRDSERRSDRASFSRESFGSDTNSTNGIAGTGLEAYRLIWERNIFNPFRSPRNISGGGAPPPRPRRTDVFGLVGTMSYDKGYFAFFDGSSSDYRKAAQPSETIADYKVKEVGPNSVTLVATNGNEVRLAVGMQMRKREDEDWQVSSYGASLRGENLSESSTNSGSTNTSSTAASASTASAGEDADVLARLLKKKEEEK